MSESCVAFLQKREKQVTEEQSEHENYYYRVFSDYKLLFNDAVISRNYYCILVQ